MSIDFHGTIALYRTTRSGVYQFLRRRADGSYEHIDEATQCPDIEGVCTTTAYTTGGREGRLIAKPWPWKRKAMDFVVLQELLKVRNQNVMIPIIKAQNSTYQFSLSGHFLRKRDIPQITVTGTYNVRNAPRSRHVPPQVVFTGPHTAVVTGLHVPTPVVFTGPPTATHVLPNVRTTIDTVEHVIRDRPVTRDPPLRAPPTIPQFVANLIAKEAEEKNEKCSITLEDITFDRASVTSCFHVFNKDALATHRASGNTQCPVCRQVCSVVNCR